MKEFSKRDRLRLSNMQFYAKHGVFAEENALGQHFRADVTLTIDLRTAGCSDDLMHTVDYGALYQVILQTMESKVFRLIETVAEELATVILRFDSRIQMVDVDLTKPNPPFKVFFDGVTVSITRSRKDLMHWAWIALGSNIGDRIEWLKQALHGLHEDEQSELYALSDIYETAPVGPVAQGAYLNQVALIRTNRTAHDLLKQLQQIEEQCGRERVIHWGPRTLDLDLLLYEEDHFSDEQLKVPHPFLAERAFVLVPLHDAIQTLVSESEHDRISRPGDVQRLHAQCRQWLINYPITSIDEQDLRAVIRYDVSESVWPGNKGV